MKGTTPLIDHLVVFRVSEAPGDPASLNDEKNVVKIILSCLRIIGVSYPVSNPLVSNRQCQTDLAVTICETVDLDPIAKAVENVDPVREFIILSMPSDDSVVEDNSGPAKRQRREGP